MPGNVWGAYYAGRCNACGSMFEAGTLVRYEGGRIVEDACDPSAARSAEAMGPNEVQAVRKAMCLKCFTVHGAGQEECS